MCTLTKKETKDSDAVSSRETVVQSQSSHGLLSLLVCAVGICACYLCYGVLQEELLTHNNNVGATFLLTSQAMTNTIFAWCWTRVSSSREQTTTAELRLNHPLLFVTSICYVLAMTCSNESLRFVSYPTAVLMKSSKLIPVMLVGHLVERRKYSLLEWLSAVCISSGVVLFHWSRMEYNKNDDESSSSLYGMILLTTSLLMDGLLGACQGLLKKSQHSRQPTAMETMLFVNLYASLLWLPACYLTGQLQHGLDQIIIHQQPLLQTMLLLNLCASLGQVFVFYCIDWFNAVTCTTITTTRKFFTILLSVWSFGHQFSVLQWCSVGLVFGGLYTSLVSKTKEQSSSGREDHDVVSKAKVE